MPKRKLTLRPGHRPAPIADQIEAKLTSLHMNRLGQLKRGNGWAREVVGLAIEGLFGGSTEAFARWAILALRDRAELEVEIPDNGPVDVLKWFEPTLDSEPGHGRAH